MGRKIPRAVKTSPEIRSTRQSKFNNHKQKPRHVSITDTPSTITVLTITAHKNLTKPRSRNPFDQFATSEQWKKKNHRLDPRPCIRLRGREFRLKNGTRLGRENEMKPRERQEGMHLLWKGRDSSVESWPTRLAGEYREHCIREFPYVSRCRC